MKKYGVSEEGVHSLYQKPITAKVVTQAELDRRASAVEEVYEISAEELDEGKPVSANRPLSSQIDILEKTADPVDSGNVVKNLQSDRLKDLWKLGPLANPYVGYSMVALTLLIGVIWKPFVGYLGLGVWVLVDAWKRGAHKYLWWAIGTAVLGALVLPVYLAKRPLLAGEVRVGGTAWNILKYFAVLWTLTSCYIAVYLFGSLAVTKELPSDDEKAWAAIFSLGFIGALWFFPMVTAMILGFFLKKSSVVETGPTGLSTSH